MSQRGSRRFKFTQASVKKLTATDPRGERWTDLVLPGFCVTVFPDGRKHFGLRYGPRHRRRFLTIGPLEVLSVEEARKQAHEVLARYRLYGDDPAYRLKRSRTMPTFEEWVETFLPRRQRETPKSAKRDESYLKRAEEYFGGRALDEIESEDVQEAREEIADARGVTTANRWMSALRACFRAAVVSGIVSRDPTQGLKLYNERNGRRRPRVLTDDELAAVVADVDKIDDPYVRGAFLLLIGTGVRKGEALSARWDEINLDLGEWRLSDTKSNAAQTVYLAPAVVNLLRSLPRIEGSPWVFPSGRRPERYHLSELHHPWQEVKERIGVPDIWVHDLRRTFGDRMKRAADLQVASEALRHANISITSSHYSPAGEERIRDTLERVVGDVIPFPKAGGG